VILADEPTGALDSRSGDQVMDVIEELNQGGQTVVLVTHDAKVAGRYAQRIISMARQQRRRRRQADAGSGHRRRPLPAGDHGGAVMRQSGRRRERTSGGASSRV